MIRTNALQTNDLALLSETDITEEYYDGKDCINRRREPFLREEYHHRHPFISGVTGQHGNAGGACPQRAGGFSGGFRQKDGKGTEIRS